MQHSKVNDMFYITTTQYCDFSLIFMTCICIEYLNLTNAWNLINWQHLRQFGKIIGKLCERIYTELTTNVNDTDNVSVLNISYDYG